MTHQKYDDEVFNDCSQFFDHSAGWPTREAIEACGGSFLRDTQPRIVLLNGRQFAEGKLDALVNEAMEKKSGDPPLRPTPTPRA